MKEKMKKVFFLIALLALVVSCRNSEILDTLDEIKSVGNEAPERAMRMMDSIRPAIERETEYVRMKGMMLDMRLRDKAFINATSSDSAKVITAYFDKHGRGGDASEAHYYAGSAYRDLKDMPNALSHFLKAEELAVHGSECDSLMLRCIYSNLAYAYFCVQDYSNGLKAALREYDIAKQTQTLDIIAIMNVGNNCLRVDSVELAYRYFKEALDSAEHTPPHYEGNLYSLLFHLSFLNKSEDADKCYAIIRRKGLTPSSFSFGKYCMLKNDFNTAIECLLPIANESPNLLLRCDAVRELYCAYGHIGNKDSICKYAELYIQLIDSANLGERQRLAATVNNQYQYYRNIKEEAAIKEENNRIRWRLYTSVSLVVLVLLLSCLCYIRAKNKHLKERLDLSDQLTMTKEVVETLRAEIDARTAQIGNSEARLSHAKQELERLNGDIAFYERELKSKEQQLIEKLEENRRFIMLLHKASLEESAEDVVKAIRKASEGKYRMTASEWQRFYHAVDELQPTLSEKLAKHLGKFSEQQQQVCYLMSIGLSNIQIENLTDIPHVTVWRWVKKFDWIT